MTEQQTWTMLAFFGMTTILVVRSGEVRAWVATVISFAGFLLALTPLGYPVLWLLRFLM